MRSEMNRGSHEIPARVIAVLTRSTIQLLLCPGAGLADGGIPTEVPLDIVPPELRLPNTMMIVTMENGRITGVRPREPST